MAKTDTEAAAQDEKKEVAATPPKFSIERLRRDSLRIFNVTVSTFDGATHGLKGEFTVEEMRDHIKKWNEKRVLPATKKEGK